MILSFALAGKRLIISLKSTMSGLEMEQANQAWLSQDSLAWTTAIAKVMITWSSGAESKLSAIIRKHCPTRTFIAEWAEQSVDPTEISWIICIIAHGSEEQGQMMEYIYQQWQLVPHTNASGELVMAVVRFINHMGLASFPFMVALQKLLELDGVFQSDDARYQDRIRTILITRHHHHAIHNNRMGDMKPILDWCFEQLPIRCDRRSYNWISRILDTRHGHAILYLVEHTRGGEFQLWMLLLRCRRAILASTSYCPELEPIRIFGVYLYLLDQGWQFSSDETAIEPVGFWAPREKIKYPDQVELVTVDFGPDLEQQVVVPCPEFIQEIVQANRSLAKSARMTVA